MMIGGKVSTEIGTCTVGGKVRWQLVSGEAVRSNRILNHGARDANCQWVAAGDLSMSS